MGFIMLQGLRDNLKGTVVASVVVLFFVLPMVITGVGSSWLGSVAGTDAASVEGRTITRQELEREVYLQRQRLLGQQGVDPSADYLKEENLRQPVLDRLTKKEAMLSSNEKGGMAISESTVNALIVAQQDFHTDGKFDAQLYRSLLARIGSSPAMYKQEMAENMVLSQLNAGIESSSFITEMEKSSLVAIINEQRSFFTVDVPADGIADAVSVSDEDVQGYYQDNQSEFLEPEKLSVNYIELSVSKLSQGIKVSAEEVEVQYQLELAAFDATPEFDIAHILINEGDDSASRITEVQEKLNAGEDFAELAKSYSDDAGSKSNGGALGVMLDGVFPEEFQNTVLALETGGISSPVKSDSGVHFIKVLDKRVRAAPSLEDRKSAIEISLKRGKAEEIFTANLELLEELTYDSDNLDSAAAELGLTVQASPLFERVRGTEIATNVQIRNAAFDPEVLVDGHNSRVIELAANRAIVLRVKEHQPERFKALAEVREQINGTLTEKAVEQVLKSKADGFIAAVEGGATAETLAGEFGYTYTFHENASRSAPVSDPQTRQKVFATALADSAVTFETNKNSDGSYRLIGITSSKPGEVSEMEPQQLVGLSTQLGRENSRFEGSAYQENVIGSSSIKVH